MKPRPEKKLMVMIKLEKEDAVQLRWLSKEKVPGREYKPKVTAVLFQGDAGTVEVAVDSTHVVEALLPEDKAGPDRYSLFFAGYFELLPDHPNHPRVKGKKGLSIDFRFVFQNKDGAGAVEGQDYEILEKKPATLSAMG